MKDLTTERLFLSDPPLARLELTIAAHAELCLSTLLPQSHVAPKRYHCIEKLCINYSSELLKYLKLLINRKIGPPLWSSGQCSWLQIRRLGFDSRHYQTKKVVGLERGPLSLVGTTEELLDRKVAAPV
jgi:hypothetical protein